MKKPCTISILTVVLCFVTGLAQAQTVRPWVVNNAGGLLQNGSLNVEWSLGELAVATLTTPNQILTQGFLQPQLDSMTNVSNVWEGGEIWIYPNPVSAFLFIETSRTDIVSAYIYDVLGRLVLETNFTPELDVRALPKGMYFMVLLDNKRPLAFAIKIIKI